jgi:type IV secretion system protein VirB6
VNGCPAFGTNGAGGVAEALRAVDCQSGLAVQSAFARLFGADGALGQALGLALTLYVGILAISILTGRSSLSLSALTPRMLGLGLALTFATSWAAYHNVVWNLLVGAPDQIASLLIGSRGSATELFATRLDQMFTAVAQAADAARTAQMGNATGAAAPPGGGLSSPVGLLNLSALMLLLSTVGVLIVARIALAALLALGPVFIILALFRGTRGLFEGWLKTSVLFAVVPLISVLVGGTALSMLTPVVRELSQAGAVIPPRLAVTVFLGAFVHMALSFLAFKAAASLTQGWRLPFSAEPGKAAAPEPATVSVAASATTALPVAGVTAGAPAIAAEAGAAGGDRARALATEAARSASASSSAESASGRDRVVVPFPARAPTSAARPPPPASPAARTAVRAWPNASVPRRRQVRRRPFPRSPRGPPMIRAAVIAALLAAPAALARPGPGRPAAHGQVRRPRRGEGAGPPQLPVHDRVRADERIENVAVGDSAAWQVTPNKRANMLFVKPILPDARTNMTVVTDQRTYLFDLVTAPAKASPFYALRFTYPEGLRLKPLPGAVETAPVLEARAAPPTAPPLRLHYGWTAQGDAGVLPSRTYDDGITTYLAWPDKTLLPAILTPGPDGAEAPVNFATNGDVIEIDQVHPVLILRAGEKKATLTRTAPAAAPAAPAVKAEATPAQPVPATRLAERAQ